MNTSATHEAPGAGWGTDDFSQSTQQSGLSSGDVCETWALMSKKGGCKDVLPLLFDAAAPFKLAHSIATLIWRAQLHNKRLKVHVESQNHTDSTSKMNLLDSF